MLIIQFSGTPPAAESIIYHLLFALSTIDFLLPIPHAKLDISPCLKVGLVQMPFNVIQ